MTSVLVSKESSRAKHQYMNVNPTIKDLFMHLVVQLSSDINIANFSSHEVAFNARLQSFLVIQLLMTCLFIIFSYPTCGYYMYPQVMIGFDSIV